MARRSAYGRLLDHFHTHPRGRLHEILFWAVCGLVLGALAYGGWRAGKVNDAIAWILVIVAACMIGFGLLPQRRPPAARPVKGKRGEIQQQVRASKAERKKKGPPPPGPPITRG